MKDEIKEILDDLLFTTTLPNVSVKLSEEKLNQLKDYITNLQEENEKLVNKIDEVVNKQQFIVEKFNYKSRNEKAIEYINKLSNEPNVFGHYGIDGNCKKYLLNILNGDE